MQAAPDSSFKTLPHHLLHWAQAKPNAVALRQKREGIWQPLTWKEYAETARNFGAGLIELGLAEGEAVAILSENRQEWVLAQLGAGMVRAVTAGVYPTSPANEVQYLLQLSEAPVVVCEDQEQVDKVLAVREHLPHLRHIIVIDPRGLRRYDNAGLHYFDQVVELGKARNSADPDALAHRLSHQQPDDVALVVFTSGSTGKPKAALLTWRSLNAGSISLNSALRQSDNDQLVSYLPLCHVAEQMFSVQIPLKTASVVNFAESLRTVQQDLREIAPQVFFGVPRIWEKFHAGIQTKVREAGGFREWVYNAAMRSISGFATKPRSTWSLSQRLIWAFWYFAVIRAVLNFIGLRDCRIAVSAGAPITPEILAFFRAIGVPVREAYGMTESSGPSTIQLETSPIGTVGPALPGYEVQLGPDGEILMRGGAVFRGYFRNPEATGEAISTEGWLHSGDIGEWVDASSGRELRIIDRKKDIMITAGGKNITPSEIENALRFSAYIKEAIVIADRRRFVSALIQIDYDAVSKWAEDSSITYTTFRSLAENDGVQALIQGEIDKVNQKMPQVQNVRKFHLLVKELDHDDGEVTATMKVRRKIVAEKYSDVIEALYA